MEKVSRAFFEKATNILAFASLLLKQPKDFSIKVREASYVNNETGSPSSMKYEKSPTSMQAVTKVNIQLTAFCLCLFQVASWTTVTPILQAGMPV